MVRRAKHSSSNDDLVAEVALIDIPGIEATDIAVVQGTEENKLILDGKL